MLFIAVVGSQRTSKAAFTSDPAPYGTASHVASFLPQHGATRSRVHSGTQDRAAPHPMWTIHIRSLSVVSPNSHVLWLHEVRHRTKTTRAKFESWAKTQRLRHEKHQDETRSLHFLTKKFHESSNAYAYSTDVPGRSYSESHRRFLSIPATCFRNSPRTTFFPFVLCTANTNRQFHEARDTAWLWPPYEIGKAIIFFAVVSIFFLSSPILSGWRLDVYHTSTHGVALVWIQNAGLKCAACGSLEIQEAKMLQTNLHLRTIPQLCRAVSSQLRRMSTIGKKLLNSRMFSTNLHNMAHFGP